MVTAKAHIEIPSTALTDPRLTATQKLVLGAATTYKRITLADLASLTNTKRLTLPRMIWTLRSIGYFRYAYDRTSREYVFEATEPTPVPISPEQVLEQLQAPDTASETLDLDIHVEPVTSLSEPVEETTDSATSETNQESGIESPSQLEG